ncbi:signal peptidase II [Catellatospora aurea]|uniref:Lipoprotein signal peptidase n=1 Tax=Catellatospora aurea TaxID=1337874 RepID=A0ABW2H134_9ACTN
MDQESEREPEHSPRRIGRGPALSVLVGMAGFAIVLDLVTKEWATKLDPHEPIRLLGGAVYMSLTRNSGAAFSLLEDHTYIFPIIALIVLGALGFMARRLRSLPWAIALGMIVGGVVGNLIDRVFRAPAPFHGHVVDFISVFDAHGRAFPIFNVADMALVGGVSLAILLELQGRQRDGSRITSEKDTATDDEPAPSAAVGSERGSQAW